ncbi:MAG: FHA domain-containing protein, partial [Planctomycetota bacterium]
MLTIELKFKDAVLKTIETDKEVITIGRNVKNDIQIDNLSVSKQHARI